MAYSLRGKFNTLFYGWRMVAIGSAVRILGGGLHYYGFTVFFLPVSQDLGLTRAATSLVFSLARAQGALEGPLAGYLIDRYGSKPIILAATVLAGMGYMLLSRVHSFTTLLLVYMGIISLSYQAGFMDATIAIAANWFVRRRAVAMAWISASIGLGGTLITPFLAFAVHRWGWRQAALAGGFAFLLLGVPLALPLRRSPESMGLQPDGDLSDRETIKAFQPDQKNSAVFPEVDFSLTETLRTYQFWVLVLATTLRVFCLSAVVVHFIPIMVWKGITEERAAVFLAGSAFLALPGHMVTGWLADRFNKPRLMAVCMGIAATSIVVLIHARQEWLIWLYLVLFSVVESIFPVSWATVGDFFGRKNFAKIRGSMSFFYMWGSVLGPVTAGFLYDRSHTYTFMLWLLIAVFIVTALAYASLMQPEPRPQK
ncbi:MAG TPA: MFS transporter [Terriglobales bacterium]|nr:MFS transporter [Terriglobales bacterium]